MMTIDDQLARLVRNYKTAIDNAEEFRRELAAVPLPVIEAAISRAMRTRRFMPNLFELLEDVDAVRPVDAPLSAPFQPCDQCSNGWIQAGPSRELLQLRGYDAGGNAILQRTSYPTTNRCSCWIEWRREQGAPTTSNRLPTMQVDKDKAIGVDVSWSTPGEIASSSPKVARFKTRVSGAGKR